VSESSLLKLEAVSVRTKLGSSYLLNKISFEIEGPEDGDRPLPRVAIVGSNGSGKTTLLRILNRSISPSEGTVYLEGRPAREVDPLQWRQDVVLVLQEAKLLGMTAREAIAYPLKLRKLARSHIQQRMTTWIERLEIPNEWLDRGETQLSGGQRQWIALCRALVLQPKILLLDEPTSALDNKRTAEILTLLKTLSDTGQTTTVVVNHQLEFVEQFCDRLLYLQEGELRSDLDSSQVDWSAIRGQLLEAKIESEREWS
jgi:D-methionine transport system ATP-binding protein